MTHIFDPRVLRDYDVRGTVGSTLFAADAQALGRSFATRVRRAGGRRVAVGRDGRLSSAMLHGALVDGLTAGGVDVVDIGRGPTPMLYYAEATLEVDGGIQVTGSHNPAKDNGFKMVLGHRSFFGADITDLARLAAAGDWEEGAGDVTRAGVMDDYVRRLVAGPPLVPFRIGWDAGNGAAGPVIEKLVKLLPGEHHLLFTDVDGHFPHHHPDPTIPTNLADLQALVAANKLDFGVAVDGDGDRIGVVDAAGRVIWADQLLSILAQSLLAEMPGATIIGDVKSSRILFDTVTQLGGRALMWKSGHSQMKSRMLETGAALAGEMSGHVFFASGWYGFDDAQYAAVRLIRALGDAGRSLAELRDAMPDFVNTPEIRFAVAEARKVAVVDEVRDRLGASDAAVDTTDGVRVTDADGWWLLRASNTEAALTVRAEGRDEAALARLLAVLDDQLRLSGVART